MNLYTGTSDLHGLAFLLTVHEDGTHELATKPLGQGWATWSPPVLLFPQSAEVE